MTISVVIPNLHSPLIDQVLACLRQQTLRAQIDQVLVVWLADQTGDVAAAVHVPLALLYVLRLFWATLVACETVLCSRLTGETTGNGERHWISCATRSLMCR